MHTIKVHLMYINIIDFSTFYTTTPHSKLKSLKKNDQYDTNIWSLAQTILVLLTL